MRTLRSASSYDASGYPHVGGRENDLVRACEIKEANDLENVFGKRYGRRLKEKR